MFNKIIKRLSSTTNTDDKFFKEIVIMKNDGYVLKILPKIDHIPKKDNYIYVDGIKYQVINLTFNYDLKCINIYVDVY